MLLVHQTGGVKVGEVIRYTITYTPSADRVIPSPSHLHLRIKNTSAIPLRGAYLLGPFALHVAAYPATFEPNRKLENPRRDGTPQFEPNLKAGATFSARLVVPEDLRIGRDGHKITGEEDRGRNSGSISGGSVTWIVEITSQILFSASSTVKFEILLGRDDKSLDYTLSVAPSRTPASGSIVDGQTRDNTSPKKRRRDSYHHQKGVYSRAINLVIEDTDSLWDKPALPVWDDVPRKSVDSRRGTDERRRRPRSKGKKKIHLVLLTHGLHSNLGADMLYLKESIDATAKVARESAKLRRKETHKGKNGLAKAGKVLGEALEHVSTAPLSGGQDTLPVDFDDDTSDSEDEEIIVRGFPGNATRTENGIQYLGKRLARYILDLTFPDQPVRFLKKKSFSQKLTSSFHSSSSSKTTTKLAVPPDEGVPSHAHSTIQSNQADAADSHNSDELAYTFTSISFVGHSLGGLIQLYAIAYIQKHAPHFFDQIRPFNFVALASPFLGLSNENPYYVRFALDLGLVGSTGRDLGLNWRAPRVAKSGWSAVMSGFSSGDKDRSRDNDIGGEVTTNPSAKPLLRVLPTGPAHIVLRKFRNRTVYSNVVNDGIVPLRTSCLLFLDWRGLGKVEKARRENGVVGTMIGWGWAEMMGQNSVAVPEDEEEEEVQDIHETDVPQPPEDALLEDNEAVKNIKSSERDKPGAKNSPTKSLKKHEEQNSSALDSLLGFLRLSAKTTKKDIKMFKRSQTLSFDELDQNGEPSINGSPRRSAATGDTDSPSESPSRGEVRAVGDAEDDAKSTAPPKTTIFESAADILSPPTPPVSWLIDPSTRARTIFHDRVYHPEDIPPPPIKRGSRSASGSSFLTGSGSGTTVKANPESPSIQDGQNSTSGSGMRVEEKIARAYHRDISWRKVLVRLEPDAHNNMVVRRTFANAYGWPVIKHLCDTHFADTWAARTRDENEPATDRARINSGKDKVVGQESSEAPEEAKHNEMMRHGTGELEPLERDGVEEVKRRLMRARSGTKDSVDVGDESYLDDTSDDDGEREHEEHPSPTPKRALERSGLPLSVPGPLRDFFNSSPSPKTGSDQNPGLKPKVADKITKGPTVIVDGNAPVPLPLSIPIPVPQKSAPAAPLLSPTEVGLRKQPMDILGRREGGHDDGSISEMVAKYASHSSISGGTV